MRTISQSKLSSLHAALTKKHAAEDAKLQALLGNPATTANSAVNIAECKKRKCALKTQMSEVQARIDSTTTPVREPTVPQQEATARTPVPAEDFLDFADSVSQFKHSEAASLAA